MHKISIRSCNWRHSPWMVLVHRWLPSSETLQNMKMCQKTNCRILHMFVIFAIGVKFVLHHKTHSFKSSTQYENENFLPWTPQNISTIFPLFNAIKIMKFFPVHFFEYEGDVGMSHEYNLSTKIQIEGLMICPL